MNTTCTGPGSEAGRWPAPSAGAAAAPPRAGGGTGGPGSRRPGTPGTSAPPAADMEKGDVY